MKNKKITWISDMTTQPVLSSSVVMMKMMNNNLHHNDYIMPWNIHACNNGTEHYRLQYTISTCISSNLLRWIHDSLSIMWFFNDLYVIFIWKHDLFKKNSNTQFSLGEEEMSLPTLSDLHKKTSENLEVKIFPTLSRR